MDAYLKCLYDHVMDSLLIRHHSDIMEYTRHSMDLDRTWDALKRDLTPEQLQLVEHYQTARASISALEDEWLFQEGVAVGKWLART